MMQVACAGLVACASPSGAVAYVAQYAAAIIGHGFHLRFTARTPWALGAYAVGLGAALGAARGDAQRGLVLATFAASLPLALVAGAKGRELDRLWMAMREARAAWMVERAASERGRIRRLTEGLRGLIGGAHDASSPFFVARLAAERLDEGEGGHADAAAGVHRSMRAVVERLEKTLAVPAVALAEPVAVAVSPIVEALARGAHRGITVETALEPCAAEVYEGADTLKRIAANVLCNAVEAARGRVRISWPERAGPDRARRRGRRAWLRRRLPGAGVRDRQGRRRRARALRRGAPRVALARRAHAGALGAAGRRSRRGSAPTRRGVERLPAVRRGRGSGGQNEEPGCFKNSTSSGVEARPRMSLR